MSDERLIRLENLRQVCAERHLGAKELANYYSTYSYWFDLLQGRKSFGEKAARRAEAALGLPDKWLDTPHKAAGHPVSKPAVVDVASCQRWRVAADRLAAHCDRLDLSMSPTTFLLLVDAAAESFKDHSDDSTAVEVFNRLWPLIQHGTKRSRP